MAVVGCVCGHNFSDNTDFLPNKARFIADQDTEAPPVMLAQDIAQLLTLPDAEARRALLVEVRTRTNPDDGAAFATSWVGDATRYADLHEALEVLTFSYWHRFTRFLYECPHCGRLLVETPDGDYLPYQPEMPPCGVLRAVPPSRPPIPPHDE
jgi:hypothetical protein